MALEGLMVQMERRANEHGERVAKSIVREIRRILVPGYGYDTGLLRSGYGYVKTPYGYAIVQTRPRRLNPPIWKYVEFGTRRMAARPHIRPAIETVKLRRR